VNLPKEIGDKMDQLIEEQKHSHRSGSSFVSEAVWRRLKKSKLIITDGLHAYDLAWKRELHTWRMLQAKY